MAPSAPGVAPTRSWLASAGAGHACVGGDMSAWATARESTVPLGYSVHGRAAALGCEWKCCSTYCGTNTGLRVRPALPPAQVRRVHEPQETELPPRSRRQSSLLAPGIPLRVNHVVEAAEQRRCGAVRLGVRGGTRDNMARSYGARTQAGPTSQGQVPVPPPTTGDSGAPAATT